MLRLTVVLCFALTACSTDVVRAQDDAPGSLKLTTERVVVFKDGYCLVLKRGVGTADKNGEIYTDEVPDAAVLGSFWAIPNEGRFLSMRAGWRKIEERTEREVPCREVIEILQANQGRTALIQLNDKAAINGTIQTVLADTTDVPAIENPTGDSATTILSSVRLVSGARDTLESRVMTRLTGGSVVMRTQTGDTYLAVNQIKSIQIANMLTTIKRPVTHTRQSKRLTFRMPEGGQPVRMTMMYFRPGIRWIPTYRVDLPEKDGDKKALVSLQAELLNEAEDLHDVPLDIVVGVPNFRFRTLPSPLTLEATLRNALAEAAPVLMRQDMNNNSFSNAMFSQRVMEHRRPGQVETVEIGGDIQLPPELTSQGMQDLFLYNLPKLTFAKSDRVAVPIFSAEVPVRDMYTWDVRLTRTDIENAPSGAGVNSPLTLSKNEVWRQVVLSNVTNVPWTTGAALLMQGKRPLAQELLTYTPSKSEVRVPVTISVDTQASFSEKETGRELHALNWGNTSYARISKEATLSIVNRKKVDVEIEVTLKLGGKATEATGEGTIELGAYDAGDWRDYHGHPAVNNSSTVQWRIKIKAGEEVKPAVKYHYYTRD